MNSLHTQTNERLCLAIKELTEFPELQLLLEESKKHLYRPLQVAVVGEYNSGKSTFLNAVLQESILPTGDIPTTGCVNYIRFGNTPSIVVHYKDGNSKSLTIDQLQYVSIHNYDNTSQKSILQQLEYIEVFKSAKILDDIVFVDTPGLNAPTKEDREVTEKLLNESNAIIWLTSARRVLAATEVEILEAFSERYQSKSLCVISQTDSLNNPREEVPKLLQHAKTTLSNYFTDIVAVSALEAVNGDEGQMKPFFNAFSQHMIPRSQEMVVHSILLDSTNLIRSTIEVYLEQQTRLNKLKTSLQELKKQADKNTNEMLIDVNRLQEDSAKKFSRLQDALITRVQKECTTWTDYEPYTQEISGFFTNDYVVKYRTIERWHWENEKVNNTHEWVTVEAESIMKIFVDECQRSFQSFTEALEQINTKFINQNEDVVNESDLNSTAQNLMVAIAFRDIISSSRSYFWGAMNHGGVHPVSWLIFMNKSESRPSSKEVTGLIEGLLPLNSLIGILNENDGFMQAIQAAVNDCYEWLENKLSSEFEQITSSCEQLKSAMRFLLQ